MHSTMLVIASIASLTLAVVGMARAQTGMSMRCVGPPDIQGIFHPVVGSGAAYDMTDS